MCVCVCVCVFVCVCVCVCPVTVNPVAVPMGTATVQRALNESAHLGCIRHRPPAGVFKLERAAVGGLGQTG
jgi:hypothetical protein